MITGVVQRITGWWFGTWILWLSIYWECHHPNWQTHIFQRGRYTISHLFLWDILFFLFFFYPMEHQPGPGNLGFGMSLPIFLRPPKSRKSKIRWLVGIHRSYFQIWILNISMSMYIYIYIYLHVYVYVIYIYTKTSTILLSLLFWWILGG